MQSTEIKVGKKNSPKISNFLVRCNWTEERDTIAVVIQQSDDAERKSHKKLKFNVILIKTLTKKLNSGKKSPKRISPGIVILFLFDDIFPHRVDCFNVLDIVAWLTIILWNAAYLLQRRENPERERWTGDNHVRFWIISPSSTRKIEFFPFVFIHFPFVSRLCVDSMLTNQQISFITWIGSTGINMRRPAIISMKFIADDVSTDSFRPLLSQQINSSNAPWKFSRRT